MKTCNQTGIGYLSRGRACARLTIPYLIPQSNEPVPDTTGDIRRGTGLAPEVVRTSPAACFLHCYPRRSSSFVFADEAELNAQGVTRYGKVHRPSRH